MLLSSAATADPAGKIRVIDGDTLSVGGEKVRLHGIDAPEVDQVCENPDGQAWRCGQWVSQEVRARYQGKTAVCAAVTTDRYGRIVATCTVAGRDMGRDLVSDGLAFAYRKYSMAYDLDEKGAAVNARGLWPHKFRSPEDFRASKVPVQVAPNTCAIKGNVSADGKRIYHMPGQKWYDRTRINTQNGEHWFCSETEARIAGWRRAKQ